MTNEFVKNRMIEYQKCIKPKVITDTNYDNLIKLLKEDIQSFKKKKNQNTYSKISLSACEDALMEKDIPFQNLANSILKVFFDYYLAGISEPIDEEVFSLMTEFFILFFNRSTTIPQLTLLNLRPITLNGQQNHPDDYFYHYKYQSLLSNETIYSSSEIIHDEAFRQYCYGICKILIINNKFDYLIEFYNNVSRLLNPITLLEYFIEFKDNIPANKYTYKLCKFINELFEKLDFIFYDSETNLTVEKQKNTSSNLSVYNVYQKILEEILTFLKEFMQNTKLFTNFIKHTSTLPPEKQLFLQCYQTLLNSEPRNLIITKIIEIYEDECKLEPIILDFSINCLDYMELVIDYFIKLIKDKDTSIYTINELNIKTYNLMNLYIRTKNFKHMRISQIYTALKELHEEIQTKLNIMQENLFTINKYLLTNYTEEKKESIVKNFLKSAFDNYKSRGRETSCTSEYAITNLDINNIDTYYNSIKNNQTLLDQIITGEILMEPYIRAKEQNYEYATGDYTNLVVCQIKALERYLKEVLIQYHRDNIWKTRPIGGTDTFGWKRIEEVSPVQFNRINHTPTAEDLNSLECGSAAYALLMAYIKEHKRNEFTISPKFMSKGIQEVRNGHLHIDTITTISDALMRRTQIAFWLLHLINELGDKGYLNR